MCIEEIQTISFMIIAAVSIRAEVTTQVVYVIF